MSFDPQRTERLDTEAKYLTLRSFTFALSLTCSHLNPIGDFLMNITSETKTASSRGADQQTFIVLGVLLQFLSTPEQIKDQISVMRGTVPSGVVIPLHSHADPEIFYVLNGSLEVFQAEGPSAGWQTVNVAEVVSIPGNVRHA